MAYALTFASKKRDGRDYVVAPLEEIWWSDEPGAFTTGAKDSWRWTMLICHPDWITIPVIEEAKESALGKNEDA